MWKAICLLLLGFAMVVTGQFCWSNAYLNSEGFPFPHCPWEDSLGPKTASDHALSGRYMTLSVYSYFAALVLFALAFAFEFARFRTQRRPDLFCLALALTGGMGFLYGGFMWFSAFVERAFI
jgi:hypothetical protein